MAQPTKCACVNPDAGRCREWRNPPPCVGDDEAELWREEQCECPCHWEDEDGNTEWDDVSATNDEKA